MSQYDSLVSWCGSYNDLLKIMADSKGSKYQVLGPTAERVDGATPNGGIYSIAFFTDNEGHPTDKAQATKMIIYEYDEKDNAIFVTTMYRENVAPQRRDQAEVQ